MLGEIPELSLKTFLDRNGAPLKVAQPEIIKCSIIQNVAYHTFFSAKPIPIFIYKKESLNVDRVTAKTIHA